MSQRREESRRGGEEEGKKIQMNDNKSFSMRKQVYQTTKETFHAHRPVYGVHLAIGRPLSYLFSYQSSLCISISRTVYVCMYKNVSVNKQIYLPTTAPDSIKNPIKK